MYKFYSLLSADEEDYEEDEEVQRALAVSLEGMKETVKLSSENKDAKSAEKEEQKPPTYPPLPEEPKGDRSLLCRIGVRLPNGRRYQRNFLRTDPIQVILFLKSCNGMLNSLYTFFFLRFHLTIVTKTLWMNYSSPSKKHEDIR